MTLWANGIDPRGMLREDAEDVCRYFLALKPLQRAIHPARWVDSMRAASDVAAVDRMPHAML